MIHWNNRNNKLMIKRDKIFPIKRNGSFIDIYWQENGEHKRISVLEKHLKAIINMELGDIEYGALVSFDEELKDDF